MVEIGFKTSYVASSGNVYQVPFALTDERLAELAVMSDEQLAAAYTFLGKV